MLKAQMERGKSDRGRPAPTLRPGVQVGTSRITWVIGSATLAVVISAAAVYLEEPPPEQALEGPVRGEKEERPPGMSRLELKPLIREDPLDLGKKLIEAESRARLWNSSAMLAGIELIVTEGKPEGPIVFSFGVTVGHPIPGATLSPQRQSFSYATKLSVKEGAHATGSAVALPDPGCPLEVAYRKLPEVTRSAGEKLGVMYRQSERHGRPIWLFTKSSGDTKHISGENCILLRD